MQRLKSHLEESYKRATENAAKIAAKNKARFDRHVTASKLEAGDRVLVRAVRLRGKHKLADKWELDVYVVVRQAGDLPVYTLRPENREGPLRTLHRDLLLPCGSLPLSVEKPDLPKLHKPRTRKSVEQSNDVNDQCDSEDDIPYEWFREQPDREIGRFTAVCEIPRPDIHPEPLFPQNEGRNLSKPHLPIDAPVSDDHLPANLSGDSCSAKAGDLPDVFPATTSRTVPEKGAMTSAYIPFNVPGSAGDDPAERDVKERKERLMIVQELPVMQCQWMVLKRMDKTALYDVQPETETDLNDCSIHTLAAHWYRLFNLCFKA